MNMRYFVGFAVAIGLLILVILLIVHPGGGSKVPQTQTPLTSYANTGTVVRLTVDGPINAPQNHRQAQITVGKDATTFEIFQGYDGNSLRTQSYPMSEAAYNSFLHALQLAGFTKGNDDKSLKDERGQCAEGNRYIYEVIQGGSDIERYWSTSCGRGSGSFQGSAGLVRDLFRAQVPNFSQAAGDVDLDLF